MKKNRLNEKGRGVVGNILWLALLGLLAWAVWQLYLHPESFNPKAATHSAYEDRPQNSQ